jgi:hypothetical protein
MRPAPWLALLFLLIVLTLAAAGGALIVRGTGRADALDAVPADVPLALQSSDPSRLARSLGRTPLSPEAQDPERSTRVLADGLAAMFQTAGVALPASAVGLLERSEDDTVLAIAREGSGGRQALLLVARVGRSAPADHAALRRSFLPEMPEGAVWSERRHRAHTFSALRGPADASPLCLTASRGLLLVSTSGALMRRALDTLDGRSRSLRRDSAAREARERLPRRADLYVHLSGDAVREWMERHEAEFAGLTRLSHLAGVTALRHAALSVQVRQGFFHERLFLALAPRGRGLPGALFEGPPRAEPRHVPDDARFAARVALSPADPSGAWRALPQTLLSSRASSPQDAFAGRLTGLEDFLDIDLGRELFGALGRDLRLAWGHAAPLPRTARGPFWQDPWQITLALRNPDAARRVLRRTDGLARALGSRRADGPDGAAVVWYELPALAPLTPAYRLQGRFLHLASSPRWLSAADAAEGDRAAVPPGAARGLPGKAHLQFHISSRRLADILPALRNGPSWSAPWRDAVREMAAGNPPLAAGAARMDASGLLLQWVSPVSAPVLVLLGLTGDNGENPEEANPPVFAQEDPLY